MEVERNLRRKLEEVRVERKCHPWPWAKSLAGTEAAEGMWTWRPVFEFELVISYRGYQLSLTGFSHLDVGIIVPNLEDCCVTRLELLYFNCLAQHPKIVMCFNKLT